VSFERMPSGRRSPLRRAGLVGVGHALGAVLGTAVVYRVLVGHGRAGVDPGAVELLRATGITALVWAYAGLLIGLAVGLRLPGGWLKQRRRWIAVHNQLNLAALALVLVHLLSFALFTPGGSLLVALVPQTAGVGALGYTAGVLAFYLAIVLGPSYYLRDRIGRRAWLVAHQFAAVSYAAALWHSLVLGADARVEGPARTGLWIAQIPLLLLFGLRLTRPLRRADELDVERRPARYAGARHAILRAAVVTGTGLAGFGVLYVLLAALGPGLKIPG
jgi:sulfoxide reductase heme-binding subunit YedZ